MLRKAIASSSSSSSSSPLTRRYLVVVDLFIDQLHLLVHVVALFHQVVPGNGGEGGVLLQHLLHPLGVDRHRLNDLPEERWKTSCRGVTWWIM